MATPLTSFRPVSIRPNAASASQRSDPNRRKPASANWWTPLFGWSSDPAEYINADPGQNANNKDPGSDPTRAGSRFALGCFTEEKAKQLRKKTLETSAFHDIMYHSAIASRLASDLSDK